jgi:hypothetical protein
MLIYLSIKDEEPVLVDWELIMAREQVLREDLLYHHSVNKEVKMLLAQEEQELD